MERGREKESWREGEIKRMRMSERVEGIEIMEGEMCIEEERLGDMWRVTWRESNGGRE